MTEQRTIYIFPGQGSQYRGIGSDLAGRFDVARRTYDESSDILGYNVADLSFEDPEQQINLTRYTQPVLLTHHMACLRVYEELASQPLVAYAAAGHSLGEYSALVVAGALSFQTALELVKLRGESMGQYGEGEMSALPLGLAEAKSWADKYFCAVAGINLDAQTVVGGGAPDLDELERAFAEQNPRKRTVRLKTEGAFHTYYMIEAARRFRESLVAARMSAPGIRVLSNYTGDYHEPDPDQIKAYLFFQLFHPVNWVGCLRTALADDINTFIEFGGGIGKGETPAEMRPNLESIIKKAARGHDVRYVPAINLNTIEAAAAPMQ